MNKPKLSIAAASRALLNVFLVIALVVLASLVGVGGAALWIYSHPEAVHTATKSPSRQSRDLADSEISTLPKLSPVRSDDDAPAQLIPARYVPSDSEIATFSESPRYTYISYNGGRQQAHLRVTTVLSASVPAPLPASETDDTTLTASTDRAPLYDAASHYITDANGRVIGIDGTAGAIAEAQAQKVMVARALPVTEPSTVVPEVRVAYPVVARKALPVDSDTSTPSEPGSFNVQAELSRDDDRPVLRAQPVTQATRNARPNLFGASDSFQSFERN